MMLTYKSELAAAIHETATDLYELGAIDKKTFCEFDESCLNKAHKAHDFSSAEKALDDVQNAFAGLAAKTGIETEDDVQALVDQVRYGK